jgi:hypothetical protein
MCGQEIRVERESALHAFECFAAVAAIERTSRGVKVRL